MKRYACSFLSALVLTALAAPSRAEAAPCYVAFIHGAGQDDVGASDNVVIHPMTRGVAMSGWWPDGHSDSSSLVHLASRQLYPAAQRCAARIIRYNSKKDGNGNTIPFFDAVAPVAAELNAFISQANIGTGQLIIVTHSMGGLVARFLINTGSPGNGYFPGLGGDYTTIVDRTKYLITIQAPHTGTKSADTLQGMIDPNEPLLEAVRSMALAFGLVETGPQAQYMTRPQLEHASSPGQWMGDSSRSKPIWSIAGDSAGSNSREANCLTNPSNDDCYLEAAWRALYDNSTSGGDGLVERNSAHAWNPSVNAWTTGIFTWLDGHINHNHGRYSWHAPQWQDWLVQSPGASTSGDPGRYIGAFGLDLPASAQR